MGKHEVPPSTAPGRLRRRSVLAALVALPVVGIGAGQAIRTARSTAPPADVRGPFVTPTVSGTRYFVSPDGDDDATGTSSGTPWRTIDGVNRRLADGTVGSGDAVLFRASATFPGKIRPRGLDLDADPGARLLLSRYDTDGSGAAPVISSYKLLDVPGEWRQSAPDEWVVDLSTEAFGRSHHGYSGAQGGSDNIGFLRVDGVVHGRRRSSRSELAEQWDFTGDGTDLYVRSAGNPATLAADLRASSGETCIKLTDGLQVRGLRVEGGGGHGVQGTARAVSVTDNEFCELGGSLLDATTRYGNGVEIWIGSSEVEVTRNVLHDIYDVALTMQGSRSGGNTGWEDVSFTENLVYRCNQSVELWSDGSADRALGFSRCSVARNVCLFAGQGWSGTVRPDQDRKVHLLTYGWTLPADVDVTANVFHDAVGGYRWSSTETPGLRTSANVVRLRPGARIANGQPDTIENTAAWTAAGNDGGSSFEVLPANTTSDVGAALRQIRDDVPLDDRARTLLDGYVARFA